MKKIYLLFVALILIALPNISLAQDYLIDFEVLTLGHYSSPPPQYPQIKGIEGDIISINPCSYNAYLKWLELIGAEYLIVGPLTHTTTVSMKYSGPTPSYGLSVKKASSLAGPYSAVNFLTLGNGPCYTIITATVDQGYYLKIEPINSQTINLDWIQSDNGALPVELVAFSATRIGDNVQLKWQTATEVNNFGFDVERSTDGKSFNKIGFVAGHGTVNTPQNYTFTDGSNAAQLFYRLKQIDRDGKTDYSSIVNVTSAMPNTIKIMSAYPNPFNPSTTISISVPVASMITLNVFDVAGRQVATIMKGEVEAGTHNFTFTPNTLSSGTYFIGLLGGDNTTFIVQKIVLSK